MLTALSYILYIWAGEANFKPLLHHSGPYGVGVKIFWTKDMENHTLVYYPISYYQWLTGVENPAKYFLSWNLFGNRG